MKRKNKDKWELVNYITTAIIAFIAILGFIFTQTSAYKTSKLLKSTSKTLKNVDNAVLSLTSPVVYFSNYEWVRGEKLDCDNPPAGIAVYYSNGSNIPLKILGYAVKITIGNDSIATLHKQLGITLTDRLTAPATLYFSTELREIFKNKRNDRIEPFIYLEFEGKVTNMSESIVYNIKLKNKINFSCLFYFQKNITNMSETYTLISTNEQ